MVCLQLCLFLLWWKTILLSSNNNKPNYSVDRETLGPGQEILVPLMSGSVHLGYFQPDSNLYRDIYKKDRRGAKELEYVHAAGTWIEQGITSLEVAKESSDASEQARLIQLGLDSVCAAKELLAQRTQYFELVNTKGVKTANQIAELFESKALAKRVVFHLLTQGYWESFLGRSYWKPANRLLRTLLSAALRSDELQGSNSGPLEPGWVKGRPLRHGGCRRGHQTHPGGRNATCEGIWRSVRRNVAGWRAIAARGLILRALMFRERDLPVRAFTKSVILRDRKKSAEDQLFCDVELEAGISMQYYRYVNAEEVKSNVAKGCCLSSCFVDRKGSELRLITNFKRVSQHWDSRGGKMESLQAFGLGIGHEDRLLSFDLKDGYRAVALHKDMQKYFMFRHGGRVYCRMTLPFGWNMSPY